jgi:hypothetical protein
MSVIKQLISLDLKALGSLTLLVSRYPAYSAFKTRRYFVANGSEMFNLPAICVASMYVDHPLHRVQLRFLG